MPKPYHFGITRYDLLKLHFYKLLIYSFLITEIKVWHISCYCTDTY